MLIIKKKFPIRSEKSTKIFLRKKSDGMPIAPTDGIHINPFKKLIEKFKEIKYEGTTDNIIINTDENLKKVLENQVDNSPIFSFNLNNTSIFNSEIKFIDSLLNENSQLFAYLIELENYTFEKQQLGQTVCENRRIEGTFINKSLSDLRDMIREILMIKNKDMLHVVPNYVNICFDKYCPSHKGCFSFNSSLSSKSSNTSSTIIQEIQRYFNDDIVNTYKKEELGEINEKLYTDLVLCIFCVFNISKGANNPPPVPYVDINELKRIVYNYNLFPNKKNTKDRKNISTFLFYAQKLINDINHSYIESYKDGEEIRSRNLLESVTTINVPKNTPFQNTGNDVRLKKIENFMTNDETNDVDFTTYYKTFLFILDNLLSGDETLTGRQEMEQLIDDIQLELNKATLQDELTKNLDKTNKTEIENKQNQIMSLFKKYKLYDLNMLIHYLKLDYERLFAANDAIKNMKNNIDNYDFETEEDKNFKGYDPRFIYNPELIKDMNEEEYNKFKNKYQFITFTEEEREDFHAQTGVTSDDFNLAFDSSTTKNNNKKMLRQRVYTAMRLYIQHKIQLLYRKIFTKDPEKSMIELVVDQQITDHSNKNAIENLSIIKKYIDQQVSYYEYDVYDNKKIRQLESIIEAYKQAQDSLINIQKIINQQIEALKEEKEDKEDITFSNLKPKIIELNQELTLLKNPDSGVNKENRTDIIKNKRHNLDLFQKNSNKYMGFLEEFLRLIDNNNDASSVGTLEFLDKMAKLNTVSTICNFETQKLEKGSDNFDSKLKLDLKPLY